MPYLQIQLYYEVLAKRYGWKIRIRSRAFACCQGCPLSPLASWETLTLVVISQPTEDSPELSPVNGSKAASMMHWATGSPRRWPEAFHHLCVPLSAFQKPLYSAFAVLGSVNLVRLSQASHTRTLESHHLCGLHPEYETQVHSPPQTMQLMWGNFHPTPTSEIAGRWCKHSGCSVPVSDHHIWALLTNSLTALSPTSTRQKKLISVLGGEKLCFISISILSSILSVPQSFHFSWITQIFWKSKSRNVFSPPSSALFAKKSF